jgi:diguanylate cyclase (GGDEF)-like protein
MHKLLARQIAKAEKGEKLDIDRLAELVSAAYGQFDEDRVRYARATRQMIAEVEQHNEAREAAIEDLAVQNRILDAALEHMVLGVAIFDADRRLVLSNARYAEIYGFPREFLVPGTRFADMVDFLLKTNQHEGAYPTEYQPDRLQDAITVRDTVQRFRDGRFIAVARRPMQNGGWVTTHEDITDREELLTRLREQHELVKMREAELRLRNVQFDVALNNMTEGFCFFDSDERLIICNERYVKMYELPPECIHPGITLREIVAMRHAAGTFPDMTLEDYYVFSHKVVANGIPVSNEIEFTNGKVFEIHHSPMPGGGWVATHEDITQRRRVEAKIAHLAHHDALTDLPNRVLLMDRLEDALQRVKRGERIAVHLFDLDHFKNVNDTLGHPIGDALLQIVGHRLRGVVRDIDTISRTGGDEFAIVQRALKEPSEAAALAERVINAVSAPYEISGHPIVIGTSIGIALAPTDGETGDELIRNADLALYRSKADGRGTHSFFEPEMHTALQLRRVLEADLRHALVAGEFELHYQPIVHQPSGRITSCEALVRWRHPQRGMLGPDTFIPLAEESGLIVPLGEWVVEEACKFAACWPEETRISVNLSPKQFRNSDLCEAVTRMLAESGLSPERLQLEVTETVLLSNNEATLVTFNRLRGMGVRVAIDDFGAGYSALSYLQKFRFDNIKIDRSFVKDVTHSVTSRSIVRAIAAMANGLGITCTAEGVETEEQQAILLSEGCAEMQGYLFSPAVSASQIMKLLRSEGAQWAPGDVQSLAANRA